MWFSKSIKEVFNEINVDVVNGLSEEEASLRLAYLYFICCSGYNSIYGRVHRCHNHNSCYNYQCCSWRNTGGESREGN